MLSGGWAGGPAYQLEGAPSKPVLLGWGFASQTTSGNAGVRVMLVFGQCRRSGKC